MFLIFRLSCLPACLSCLPACLSCLPACLSFQPACLVSAWRETPTGIPLQGWNAALAEGGPFPRQEEGAGRGGVRGWSGCRRRKCHSRADHESSGQWLPHGVVRRGQEGLRPGSPSVGGSARQDHSTFPDPCPETHMPVVSSSSSWCRCVSVQCMHEPVPTCMRNAT